MKTFALYIIPVYLALLSTLLCSEFYDYAGDSILGRREREEICEDPLPVRFRRRVGEDINYYDEVLESNAFVSYSFASIEEEMKPDFNSISASPSHSVISEFDEMEPCKFHNEFSEYGDAAFYNLPDELASNLEYDFIEESIFASDSSFFHTHTGYDNYNRDM